MRIAALAGLIAALTCANAPDPVAGASAVDGSAPVDITRAQLERLAVYDDDFVRAELYTWTTVEQLRRVRDTRQLLVADAATGGRASPFNRALQRPEPIEATVLEPSWRWKRRRAWPLLLASSGDRFMAA